MSGQSTARRRPQFENPSRKLLGFGHEETITEIMVRVSEEARTDIQEAFRRATEKESLNSN